MWYLEADMPRLLRRVPQPGSYRRAALLILSLAALAAGATGCALPQAQAQRTRQPQATQPPPASANPTATAIIVGGIPFQTITDPTFGFRLDIPASMTQNGSQQNSSDGGGVSTWNGTLPTVQEALDIEIDTATEGLPAQSCATGKPITIGPGLPGYEQDVFAQPTPIPQPNSGAITASVIATVVVHGLFVAIRLDGSPPNGTFMDRYGAIWRHMLASFRPGAFVSAGNPCGS
jgi:hypothetical protein